MTSSLLSPASGKRTRKRAAIAPFLRRLFIREISPDPESGGHPKLLRQPDVQLSDSAYELLLLFRPVIVRPIDGGYRAIGNLAVFDWHCQMAAATGDGRRQVLAVVIPDEYIDGQGMRAVESHLIPLLWEELKTRDERTTRRELRNLGRPELMPKPLARSLKPITR